MYLNHLLILPSRTFPGLCWWKELIWPRASIGQPTRKDKGTARLWFFSAKLRPWLMECRDRRNGRSCCNWLLERWPGLGILSNWPISKDLSHRCSSINWKLWCWVLHIRYSFFLYQATNLLQTIPCRTSDKNLNWFVLILKDEHLMQFATIRIQYNTGTSKLLKSRNLL